MGARHGARIAMPVAPSPSPIDSAAGEAALLAAARAGAPAALAELMGRNNRRLFRLARGILRNDADAEDVVQESWLRAFAALDGFKGEAALGTWLSRIVVNEALGRLRRRRPTVALETLEDGEGGAAASAGPHGPASPEHAAARGEIRRLVQQALERLPLPFRLVFVLRAVEQLSIAETAACLGIREETVKTRFHRANRQLRDALGAEIGAILDDLYPFAGPRCRGLAVRVLHRLAAGAAAPEPAASPGDWPAPPEPADPAGRMEDLE
jgi:RNA polymerase sigma-70 factor (ECF subfamily)